ncbi:MAG: hypothetical protein AABY95_03870 [Pseudomonadota bacterium]
MAILLANIMWLTPSVQVFAGTMADTHCRATRHISATAPDAAHDPKHAQHHGGMDMGANHMNHGVSQQTEDAEQCKCGCICNLACAASTALVPTLMTPDALPPEHFAAVFSSAHPHSIHAVLQRPPISS